MQNKEEKMKICSICQKEYVGWGNDAMPVNDGQCCNYCDNFIVIPARLTILRRERKK